MENKEKSPEQELVESIGLMMEKGMSYSDKILTGVIKSIDGKKANVNINGREQSVSVCTPELLVGAVSRIFVPGNNMSNAFIIGNQSSESSEQPKEPSVKFETGSYYGNGKYGQSNKNLITFSKIQPQFVVVMTGNMDRGSFMFFIRPVNKSSGFAQAYGVIGNVTWGATKIEWYETQNAIFQLNNDGTQYYYFGIGTELEE